MEVVRLVVDEEVALEVDAAAGVDAAGEDVEKGGFAGAGGSHDGGDLAMGDYAGDVL